jgi:ubiquinone/menaquinone biosynthesis C-methylase UbiE
VARTSKDHVRSEYDDAAGDYESRWSDYTRRSILETLSRAPIEPHDSVLDVGCGTGSLLRELQTRVPTASATGVDLSLGMAAIARRRGVVALAGDAENLPFRDATFDVVISSSSFHFWPDRLRGLGEIRRVLKAGGRVVLTDWCDDFIACRVCDLYLRWRDRAHQPIVNKAECRSLLTDSGFEIRTLEQYRISWLWGLMTAVATVRG